MCGLIGWLSKESKDVSTFKATDYVAEQFENQKSRGTRGFGVTEIGEDGFVRVMRSKDELKMMVDLRLSRAKHILLHHRMPTSTDNTTDQTHPIVVLNEELKYEWLVNHNGVIRNSHELKEKHNALGYEYTTEHESKQYPSSTVSVTKFNDSEAFAIELARYLEGKSEDVASQGTMAFMAVKMKDGFVVDVIIGTNGGNPLGWADMGFGWQFASQELYGDDLKTDEAITFKARYNKKHDKLLGFKVITDLPELTFRKEEQKSYFPASTVPAAPAKGPSEQKGKEAVAQAPASVASPLGVRDHKLHWPENSEDSYTRPIGFHRGMTSRGGGLEVAGVDTEDIPNLESSMGTYAQILHVLRKESVGEVFTKFKDHEVITAFNKKYIDFCLLFSAGKILDAETLWNEFIDLDELSQSFDFTVPVEAAIEYETDFQDLESLDSILKTAQNVVKTKMGLIAHDFTPIFKLQAFIATALVLGYGLKKHLEKAQKDREGTTDKEQHDLAWGPLHLIKDCKQSEHHDKTDLERSAEQVGEMLKMSKQRTNDQVGMDPKFYTEELAMHNTVWGNVHDAERCGAPQFHLNDAEQESIIEAEYFESAVPPKETPDEEADMFLQILAETTDTMSPDEVISEAEGVGERIKEVASNQIHDQLLQMQAAAAEQGVEVSIPFYNNKILEINKTATARFEKLARIVKAAKSAMEYEEAINND